MAASFPWVRISFTFGQHRGRLTALAGQGAYQRPRYHHEQRSGHALARNIGDGHQQVVLVEEFEIIEIAAHFAGRLQQKRTDRIHSRSGNGGNVDGNMLCWMDEAMVSSLSIRSLAAVVMVRSWMLLLEVPGHGG